MGTNLPSDFFSWKSFQSLTQTAALAWILTLVIDVIFIQGISDPYSQVVWIWIVGGILCLILAMVRLYFKVEKEKGDKFLVIFNAALIFLYASGFNGFTKELGSWSEVNKGRSEIVLPGKFQQLEAAIASWVPNVFGNQTAFWPDVKMMYENRFLKYENERLQESLRNMSPNGSQDLSQRIQELERENARLRKQMAGGGSSPNNDALQTLTKERDLAVLQLNTLLARVDESNQRISQYGQMMSGETKLRKQEESFYNVMATDFKHLGGGNYVYLVTKILTTPIDTNLPQ